MASEVLPMPSNDLTNCHSCSFSFSLINSTSAAAIWQRAVKRKFEQIEDGVQDVPPTNDYSSVARVEIENECVALREALSRSQQTIQVLYTELEEERNASSSAANEAMSMILRLQREKAEIQMEARQFKRFAEEKMAHDQEEVIVLDDQLCRKEQAIRSLYCEVQAYKHRMLSFGLTESEVEGEKEGYSRSQSFVENFHMPNEVPPFDYPPLKCNINENQGPLEVDEDVIDIEKYAFGETPHAPFGETPHTNFGETPRAREHLQNLEYRIFQLEKTPRSPQMDREFSGTKNILEKAVVDQSPRRSRHAKKLSADSSSSLYEPAKEMGQVSGVDNPMPISSFKKMEFSQPVEYSNMRKVDNASDLGDNMSDRVYTIDSIHHGAPNNSATGLKAGIGISEDYLDTPRESLNRADITDPDIKKLYMRLQALEADRESMRQALISMRTDKTQLVLLREIAQQLYKEMSPERRMPVRKPSLIGSFSFMSALKWVVSFIFWRKKARRSKYMFGLSANNVGLLLLLDKSTHMRQWRCITRAQM